MSEVLNEQILDASFRVINHQEREAYTVMSLIKPPCSENGAVFAKPIFASSIYMVPDYANPRLGKANMLINKISNEVAEEHIEPNMDYLSHNQNFYNPNGFRQMSWKVRAACEELEATEADRQKLFKILGISAIYMMDDTSYMFQFYSREFLNALARQMDPIEDSREMPESRQRDVYAAESEHKLHLPPFEEWARQKQTAVNQRLSSGLNMPEQAAIAYTQPLLLPIEDMAPVLRTQLFEATPE